MKGILQQEKMVRTMNFGREFTVLSFAEGRACRIEVKRNGEYAGLCSRRVGK